VARRYIEVFLGSSAVFCLGTLDAAIPFGLSIHMLPPVPSTLARTLFTSKVAIAVADAHPAVGVGFPPPFLFVPGATSLALIVKMPSPKMLNIISITYLI